MVVLRSISTVMMPPGFDAQRQRGHVEQQHVFDVTGQHAALDGGAEGNDFVRVDVLLGFLAEDFGADFLGGWHAGRTTDQDDFVDVAGRQAGVLEGLDAGLAAALDQALGEVLEGGAGQGHVEVLGAPSTMVMNGRLMVAWVTPGQFFLGLFGGFLQALQGHVVLAQVNAVFFLELISDMVDDGFVEVVTTEVGVTVGGQHFDDAVADFEDRDVEGTATEGRRPRSSRCSACRGRRPGRRRWAR